MKRDRERPDWMETMDAIAYFGLFVIMMGICVFELVSVTAKAVGRAL